MLTLRPIKRLWSKVFEWSEDVVLRVEESIRGHNKQPEERKIIVAARKDGLGGRLCSMMNAMDLADRLTLPFYFMWPRVTADHKFNAISPVDRIFSDQFIAAHHKESLQSDRFITIDGNPVDRKVVDQIRDDRRLAGLLVGTWAERVPLEGDFPASKTAAELFARIELTKRMQAAVNAAAIVDLKDACAIHVRCGDIIHGDSRFRLFNDKFSPRPLVAEVIRHHRDLGQKVVVFSDDADLLRDLSLETGAQSPGNFGGDQFTDADQRALFEIVLMSQCREIVAAFSAFAMAAAFIGGKRVINLRERFRDIAEKRALLGEDHTKNATSLEKAKLLQFVATQLRSVTPRRESIALLSQASILDPENTTYQQIRAIYLLRSGKRREAEQVLQLCAESHFRGTGGAAAELGRSFQHLYKHHGLLADHLRDPETGDLPYILAHYAEIVRATRTRSTAEVLGLSQRAHFSAPQSALLLVYYASRLMEEARYRDSLELLQSHLGQHAGIPVLHVLLAECASRQGQDETALRAAVRAHELAPEDQQISVRLGLMYARAGHLEEACRIADALRTVTQSNQAPLLYQYGRLLEAVERYDDAHQVLLEAVKLRPLKKPYRSRFAKLERRLARRARERNLH